MTVQFTFHRLFIAITTLAAAALSLAPEAAAQQRDLLVVFDASGSMWGQVSGENKIVTARRVLGDVTGGLPSETQLGLIAYGHRRKGDCADIETLVTPAAGKAGALKAAVDGINPTGKTPITASLNQAVALAKGRSRPTTIVLLSDGIETCGGDVCAAVKKAKAANVDFLLHIIGFDIGQEDVAPFECAAQAGGGMYFDAAGADELVVAMEQAMEPEPELGDATLSVKALRNGALADAIVEVYPAGKSEREYYGRTYTATTTNPRQLVVPAGSYDVKVRVLGMTAPPVEFRSVEIPKGELVEKVADFSSGKISVKVTKNGELYDATVNVTDRGTKKRIGGGRTYTRATSNPRVVEVPPGTYDVKVQPLGASGVSAKVFEAVTVKATETVELAHTLTTGELSVKVLRNGKLSDATVRVTDQGTGKSIANGRTYVSTKSNPKVFTMPPGTYNISVTPLEAKGVDIKTFTGVEVAPDARKEVEWAFESGTLTITTVAGGSAVDSTVNIVRVGQGAAVARGRTYGKPKVFELAPGKYAVSLKPLRAPNAQPGTVEVEVKANGSLDKAIDLTK